MSIRFPDLAAIRFARVFFPYAIPLVVFLYAPFLSIGDISIAFAAVIVALVQFFFRPLSATLIVVPLIGAVSIANSTKLSYAGESLIYQDFVFALPHLNENLGTVIQYVDPAIALCMLFACAMVILAIRTEARYFVRSRIAAAALFGILAVNYVPTVWGEITDILDGLPSASHGNAWTFSGHHSSSDLSRFLLSTQIKSADFKYERVGSEIFESYPAPDYAPENEGYGQRRPDVIVILQESQFDPRQLSACSSRVDCDLTMFGPTKGSRQFGPLHVHVFGAGTWNSELALMTGTPHTWYGGAGYQPYNLAPRIRHALGHQMKDLGYRTAVVYPVQKGMMNAANAYRAYGMDEFYGAEALGLELDWCQVTDEIMYRKLSQVRQRLAAEDARPLFLVMLTIFNHTPYGERCATSDDTISYADIPEKKLSKKLDDYLRRSRAADHASKTFREEVLSSDRPSLVLVFGDHQPSFSGMERNLARATHRPMQQEEAIQFTNYQFFSNINVNQPVKRELDVIFLSSALLTLAGLPLDPVFEANFRLMEICNGRLDLCPVGPFLDSYRDHLMGTGFYR